MTLARVEAQGDRLVVVNMNATRRGALSPDLYAAIAELMYRAVRIGGIPCSGLPWRWGYGWPECG